MLCLQDETMLAAWWPVVVFLLYEEKGSRYTRGQGELRTVRTQSSSRIIVRAAQRLIFHCCQSIPSPVGPVNQSGPGSWLWCTGAADSFCQSRTVCSHLWRFGRSRSLRCRTARTAGRWETPCERRWILRRSGCSSSVLFPHRRTWTLRCSSRGFWPLLVDEWWLQPPWGLWRLGPAARRLPAP